MSSQRKRLPHEIDPFRLVEARAELGGRIPLKQFRRLSPLLMDDSGDISVTLSFDNDELGVPCVTGNIRTNLDLVCQRCLESYKFPVDLDVSLAWIRSEKEAESLPLRYEPYLVTDNPLKLNDVIEDELLLALPQIPMHDESVCEAAKWIGKKAAAEKEDAEMENREENPFSVLQDLKSKD